MVELKILEESEAVAERLRAGEMIAEGVFEVSPRKAAKLVARGAARRPRRQISRRTPPTPAVQTPSKNSVPAMKQGLFRYRDRGRM